VLALGEFEEASSQERASLQVKGQRRLCNRSPLFVCVAGGRRKMTKIVHRERDGTFSMSDLSESAIGHRKAGAKDFVPPNDFIEGAFQDIDIESSDNAKAYRNVPAGIARLKPIEVPEGFLCQARRKAVKGLA
jgi:hypothetical protein